MKLIGLMPVRNEAWCLGLSARVALKWCDELVILDHASTDGTRDIIQDLMNENPTRISMHREVSPVWNEMEHRQSMLTQARSEGATHIAIIDADEVLTGNLLDTGKPYLDYIAAMPRGSVLQLPGYNLRGGIEHFHDNGVWGNRWFSLAFADDPWLSWSGDKFHSREPGGLPLKPYRPVAQGHGGVMHLWASSEKRLVAKHRLYRITERIRWPDKDVREIERMYSWATDGEPGNVAYGTPKTWTYAPVPQSWWAPYSDLLKYLDLNAEPWQDKESDRLIEQYGAAYFKGLRVHYGEAGQLI